MSSANGPTPGLPVRMPRPRQPGRHRRPEPLSAPDGAPALVLAIPGDPTPEVRRLVEEIVSTARPELPGLDIRTGHLCAPAASGEREPSDDPAEPAGSSDAFPRFGIRRPSYQALADVLRELGRADRPEDAEGLPRAVVVPLLAGPDAAVLDAVRSAVAEADVPAEVTGPLGPHPLLAEAVHVRLSEVGLARADRARLFTVATAADGIILASVGGEPAVASAGVTGMLLSARLALPVLAAGLDLPGSVARIAEQLRAAGSGRLALAPYAIGPEVPEGLLAEAAEAAGCPAAEALGASPGIGRLAVTAYLAALGITPPQPHNAPTR